MRTPDPDPNERDDDGTPRDPLGGVGASFGPGGRSVGDGTFGSPTPDAAANPGWYGHTGAGSQMTHVTEINPARNVGYVLFTNEGQIDDLVGPGSELNQRIHRWLDENYP